MVSLKTQNIVYKITLTVEPSAGFDSTPTNWLNVHSNQQLLYGVSKIQTTDD